MGELASKGSYRQLKKLLDEFDELGMADQSIVGLLQSTIDHYRENLIPKMPLLVRPQTALLANRIDVKLRKYRIRLLEHVEKAANKKRITPNKAINWGDATPMSSLYWEMDKPFLLGPRGNTLFNKHANGLLYVSLFENATVCENLPALESLLDSMTQRGLLNKETGHGEIWKLVDVVDFNYITMPYIHSCVDLLVSHGANLDIQRDGETILARSAVMMTNIISIVRENATGLVDALIDHGCQWENLEGKISASAWELLLNRPGVIRQRLGHIAGAIKPNDIKEANKPQI